ncbi:13010_t:CDS:2, partial [Gigaspora rosea]
STVSKILKKTDEYQQIQDDLQAEKTFRYRSVKYPMLELAMNMWVEWVATEGLILSESLIKEKGRQFAQALNIPEESLTFSNEWISRFKKCNGLRKVTIHGEAGSAPLETLPAECDKTRVTVLLCSNSTGSDKLRPLVIGTSKKPRSFNGINISQLPVTYRNNKKAWMRTDIWEKWLKFIDKGFRIQGRQVLLLVDNASSHTAPETSNPTEVQDDTEESALEDSSAKEIEEIREQPRERRISDKLYLTNVTVHFLLPLTTAHLQPMDAGIIKSFKSKYKNIYCRYLLNQFEKNKEQRKLTIRKAIDFISDAWEEVSETTIRNCWKTTRIMSEMNEPEESESDDEPEYEIPEVNDVAMLACDLSHETNPAAQELESNINEYIYMIDQPTVTEDILTDDGIIEAAIEALEKVIRYQESLDVGIGFDEYELVTLRKKLKKWRSEKEKNKKQSFLLSFFGSTSAAS